MAYLFSSYGYCRRLNGIIGPFLPQDSIKANRLSLWQFRAENTGLTDYTILNTKETHIFCQHHSSWQAARLVLNIVFVSGCCRAYSFLGVGKLIKASDVQVFSKENKPVLRTSRNSHIFMKELSNKKSAV